jgi:Ca2+/Na+ antiporter
MVAKIILFIITRLFEILVVFVTSTWIWNNFPESYKLWVILLFLFLYLVYMAVTLSSDYRDFKYGEGEIPQY